jgi:hypothetical protein
LVWAQAAGPLAVVVGNNAKFAQGAVAPRFNVTTRGSHSAGDGHDDRIACVFTHGSTDSACYWACRLRTRSEGRARTSTPSLHDCTAADNPTRELSNLRTAAVHARGSGRCTAVSTTIPKWQPYSVHIVATATAVVEVVVCPALAIALAEVARPQPRSLAMLDVGIARAVGGSDDREAVCTTRERPRCA